MAGALLNLTTYTHVPPQLSLGQRSTARPGVGEGVTGEPALGFLAQLRAGHSPCHSPGYPEQTGWGGTGKRARPCGVAGQ